MVATGIEVHSLTSKQYDNTIKELETEVERLSDTSVTYEETTKEITISLVESEIKDIGELITVGYMYTDVEKFENVKNMFGVDLPFTEKSVITRWDGVIKAGINVDNIKINIDNKNKIILITLPDAEIISHEVSNIDIVDEKDGLFNPVRIEDIESFDFVNKDEMEKRAIENGLMEKAMKNSVSIIEKLVNNDVIQKQGYTVEFN